MNGTSWVLLALIILAGALFAFMASGGGYLLLISNDTIDRCVQSGGQWDPQADKCAKSTQ